MRTTLAALLLASALAAPALAQPRPAMPAPGADATPDPSADAAPAQPAAPATADYCGFLRNQITQAEQTLRQLVVSINATGRTDAPAQLVTRAAWMDQWAGRLAGYVEATTPANCLSPAQLEAARQVVAQYGAFASQARDFATRPAESASASASQPPTAAQRRQQRRDQQRREQDFQQSILP